MRILCGDCHCDGDGDNENDDDDGGGGDDDDIATMHVDGWTCSETNQVAKDDQNISEVSWQ